MPDTDLDAVTSYINNYMLMIAQKHGNVGANALEIVLRSLRNIYRYIEPEIIRGKIIVFKTLEDIKPIPVDDAKIIFDLQALPQEVQDTFTIQVLSNGQFLLWKNMVPDIPTLANQAVVYEYKDRTERFFAKDDNRIVPKIHSSRASEFSIPTFCAKMSETTLPKKLESNIIGRGEKNVSTTTKYSTTKYSAQPQR